ncbi:four-carbon acid sugar kinase family protein [Devosia submarina]|uniref:four-carbon acid sugar kinase family protein n=1 Tax=Devosia submarina TaxID=1173082 RepID=UPI000D372926|nr:four-carbon acid sugar kinase family protein [Devosia submarina]
MSKLPEGLLVGWYGDDFTGAAATMEAMTFAGLPAAVFLAPPDAQMLSRLPGLRGVGIAGTARSETPQWMRRHLPELFEGLARTGAPLLQYKICSTLDSAPDLGSIGTALEVAQEVLGVQFFPILPAAPLMGRYQAFGNLFASAQGDVHRLDRHPVMARHPATPMLEADVAHHLAAQTRMRLRNLGLDRLQAGDAPDLLAQWRAEGKVGVTLDAVSMDDLAILGRCLWEGRGPDMLCIASQGLQYALLEHWRREGLLPPPPRTDSIGPAGPVVVVSGSVSPTTAAQIDHAEAHGFTVIAADPIELIEQPAHAVASLVARAAAQLASSRDLLICTARGPDDNSVARFRAWQASSGQSPTVLYQAIGEALGDILLRLVAKGQLRRAVISGGDTSGHALRKLDPFALTALRPTIPGAALCRLHAENPLIDGLQLALKGGQMGTEDYFSWIRSGAGERELV